MKVGINWPLALCRTSLLYCGPLLPDASLQRVFSLSKKLLCCFRAHTTLQFRQHYISLSGEMGVCSSIL
jgi:hypothetical protein